MHNIMRVSKGEVTLEFYNKRAIQILELLKKSKKSMTSDQIAVSMGVSSRTVRNDIKELNAYLKACQAEIVSKSGEGVLLVIRDEELFQKMKHSLDEMKSEKKLPNIIPSNPQDRVRYIISRLLIASLNVGENIDFYDLEEELYVGTSTLKKDLRMMEKILQQYGLKISITKKSGVKITGDEAKVRYCISEYVFNNVGTISLEDNPFYKELFTEQEVNSIRKILSEAIFNYSLRLSDTAFKNLLIHILIMLKRYENAGAVVYQPDIIEAFKGRKEYCCAKEIANEICMQTKVEIGDEVYYITQHLMSSQRFLGENDGNGYHYKGTQDILVKIKEQTGIDLSDDDLLITGLDTHLSAALQRLKFNMNIRNEVLDMVKTSYPLAFELAVLAGEVIETDYRLQMKESEIGYMAIHFAVALGRKGLSTEEMIKTAIIVCGAGRVTAMLMKEKIKQIFSDRIEIIQVCSVRDLTQEMIDSVDFVFTTVNLEGYSSEKIRRVKMFLDDADIRGISQALKINNTRDGVNFRAIFREDLFFTGLNLKTREAVLTYLTDILVEKKCISESVRQSIFKREEMATTELGCFVAIPHALLNDMENATVAVAILKKPIIWEKEKVQVVLVLNIPKSKNGVWEIVFKRLYRELIMEQGVTWLIKNQKYKEFIEKLGRV